MGRPKGIPNKNTREIKAALQEAFEKLGGVESLVAWGMENQTAFYQLWSKMAPLKVEHTGEDGAPIEMVAMSAEEAYKRMLDGNT